MDMFDLSPEELSALALALAIAIGLAKQYPDDGQLGILTALFVSIGDTLALIQVQRASLGERAKVDKPDV